jgi:hypothetical protein
VLQGGRFERVAADVAGLYKSETLPGLWLDPAALMDGKLARVIEVVQQGLAESRHADFVARLAGSKQQ